MIRKVTSKLSQWKTKNLSVGGRLSLLKSVLGANPTYFMSTFRAPKFVVNHLKSFHNAFLLWADLEEHKMTWVKWKKVLAPT